MSSDLTVAKIWEASKYLNEFEPDRPFLILQGNKFYTETQYFNKFIKPLLNNRKQ